MKEETGPPLKLLALDNDDLKVLSAHLQDAVLRIEDMAFVPSAKRFAAVLNRFDWLASDQTGAQLRCRCAVRFERVLQAQFQNIDVHDPSAVAELLAITYEETDAPSGDITLFFAGGGAIRLHVECIEAELCDLGSVWAAVSRPEHQETKATAGVKLA